MVKHLTHYITRAAIPIYSEGGQFYVHYENRGWRILPDYRQAYTWGWEPEPNNVNRLNVNLFGEGTIGNLKRRRNRAARTIQRFERGRAARRSTAVRRTPVARLPNNILRRLRIL